MTDFLEALRLFNGTFALVVLAMLSWAVAGRWSGYDGMMRSLSAALLLVMFNASAGSWEQRTQHAPVGFRTAITTVILLLVFIGLTVFKRSYYRTMIRELRDPDA